jgi:hypothetical protein
MASMFDRFKKSLGLKGKDKVNGDGKSHASAEYTVLFEEQKLGFQVSEDIRDGGSCVCAVVAGSVAERKGVRVGDKVLSLDGNEVRLHSNFMATFEALGRPLSITFCRSPAVAPVTAPVSAKPASSNFSFQSLTGSSSATAPPRKENVTPEERERRRRMMAEAAMQREQAWNNKLSTSKQINSSKPKVTILGHLTQPF